VPDPASGPVQAPPALDVAVLLRWGGAALAALRAHRREIDDLNVYPVADSDTGTNLLLTWEAVDEALRTAGGTAADPAPLGRAVAAMASGALLGARGNSGVILSQLLRGMADVLAPLGSAGGAQLAAALGRAAESAYEAVAVPVEGTVLTVARAAAEAARAAEPADDLGAVTRAAARGAAAALARTPGQLAVLARAGVVDAGGRGLVLLLEALAQAVDGRPPSDLPPVLVPRPEGALDGQRESGSADFGYEVQYLLDAGDEAVGRLRTELAGLGDSLVVVGGDGLWNVHVHVDDVGAAVEAGVRAGRPHLIRVTRFADQVADRAAARGGCRTVLALAHGPGLELLFSNAGASVLRADTSGELPAAHLLDAVLATGGSDVVLLPNDARLLAAAEQAAADAGVPVVVVPTTSPVAGLAALAVADPQRGLDDDVAAMLAATAACRCAAVTGRDPAAAAVRVLDELLASGGELVTLVLGADAPAGLADRVREHLAAAWPAVEAAVHQGGQPDCPLLLGVE